MKQKRVLLKLSGEALKNKNEGIIDFVYLKDICKKIIDFKKLGYDVSIVVGGGNIWRGRDNTYINSSLSDKIGILSTTINSLILHSAFNELNFQSVVLNSFKAEGIVGITSVDKIEKYFKENKIIIFGGGIGVVGCSTDTAAALRAIESNSDVIIKLTNVDGVYNKDPKKHYDAIKLDQVSYDEVIKDNLNVMDIGSIEMCKENSIKIIVMNINKLDDIENILISGKDSTIVS
ncbi:MAG: UMP kinase [bacterium]|nr:UMP kinase [bacterium]